MRKFIAIQVVIGIILLGCLVKAQLRIADLNDPWEDPGPTDTPEKKIVLPSQQVTVSCNSGSMCIRLSKEWLSKFWGVTSQRELTLQDPCDETTKETDAEYILCTHEGRLMTCGSEFFQNDTHVKITNDVHILFSSDSPSFVPLVRATLPWECTYPLKVLVNAQYVPQISSVTVFLGNKTGYGKFEAAMFLYKDDEFKHAYDSVPYLDVRDKLRVKVQLLGGPEDSKLQVVKCWGTPKQLPREGDLSYTLIEDYCPSEEGARANVILRNNGDLHHALWESKVFRFVSQSQVFIHCQVKVCFDGKSCEKICMKSDGSKRRKRRELINNKFGLVSLGPLRTGENVRAVTTEEEKPLKLDEESAATTQEQEATLFGLPRTAVLMVIGALVALCVVITLGVSLIIYRKRQQKRQRNSEDFWKEQLSKRYRLSKQFTLSNGPPFEIPISVPNTLALPERRSSELPR